MRVLVVEPDSATRAILLSTLRARRHQVTACADAESAWAEIGSEVAALPFEVAILNVALPGQDGIAFCRRFKRHAAGRHAVILAVTADERIESLEAALESGVHDYVVSPVDPRILTIRVAMAEQRSLTNATSRYSREALRESESRFEAFMSAATVGPPARWQGSGMVLLVDDEDAVRGVARRVLERSGFGIVEASTGDDALARCHEHDGKLCLVLLDLTMPGLSGGDHARRIRRRWPSLPVVVSSGLVPEDGGGLSAVPFLAKPSRRSRSSSIS